jgi:tRNA (uracil-5-)-methyltransferase TRM9
MNETYNAIASDFSRTRHTVWPRVAAFLTSLPPHAKTLEVGCGNGKNMLYRPDLSMKGLDITEEFLAICTSRGLHVQHGDARAIPEPSASYDAVLSIAVIHHLKTKEERRQALREIARVLKPGGTALISVWAFQQEGERRRFATQDEMVPFITKTTTVYRYYHLYEAAELQEDFEASVGNRGIQWTITEERGNWYVLLEALAHGGPTTVPHVPQAHSIPHDGSDTHA